MSDIQEPHTDSVVRPSWPPKFSSEGAGRPPRSKREVAAFENHGQRLAIATAKSENMVRRRFSRWKR